MLEIREEDFIEEMEENLEEIESILVNTQEIEKLPVFMVKNLFQNIQGLASFNEYPLIHKLSQAMVLFFEHIDYLQAPVTQNFFDIILIAKVYIKQLLSSIHDPEFHASIEKILEMLNKAASGTVVDVDETYMKDIVSFKLKRAEKEDEVKIDLTQQVPVQIKTIDNIVVKLNELILTQYQMKKKIEEIYQFGANFKKLLNHPQTTADDFKREQKKLELIENEINSYILKLDTSSFQMQEYILSLRMVPLSLLTDEIQLIALKTAQEFNKEIELNTIHNSIMVDKIILENLKIPLLNIVTNAIEHGIERPEERESKGKKRQGKLQIRAFESSGRIRLIVEDDGNGIHYDAIRQSAIQLFPHRKNQILKTIPEKLNRLLFIKGITAHNQEGKGFGLSDSIKSIKAIKGKISLKNRKTQGVRFHLSFPKSLTTFYGYFIKSGGEKFFIPSIYISEILIVHQNDILDLSTMQAVKLRKDIVPVYPLTALSEGKNSSSTKFPLLIVKSHNETIGIIVDEVLYHTVAIYKPLPQLLQSISALQGIVFDEDFKIVNILYIPKIIQMLKETKNIDYKEQYSENNISYKSVLIIDDSAVNREITTVMLKRNRFSVETAIDGIEGLQKIKGKNYHLIITDTNMPRMDGLTFIENCRKVNGYEKTPIVVLAPSQEAIDRDFYQKAGADQIHFKADFDRDIFIEDIKQLLGMNDEKTEDSSH